MKRFIALLSALMVFAVSMSWIAFANHDGWVTPQWQPPVHNNNLNFQATYQNGVVNMNWSHFYPSSSSWNYRKVVRSTNIEHPYYPDNGYIKAIGDQNTISYTDTNPPAGTVYYGVCAITKNSYGKYRNCDWQAVAVDGSSVVTPTPVPVPTLAPVVTNLSASLKAAVDVMITKLLNNLEDKFGDDRNAKISLLETLSTKLATIKVNYRIKPMITYLVEKIDEAIALLQIEVLLDID